MSHKYKEYSTRTEEIDENQKKVMKEFKDIQNMYIKNSIFNQFETSDRLIMAVNYYIKKRVNNEINLFIIEDIMIFLVGYCKFISVATFQMIFSNSVVAKKYIDCVNRLVKKGYIEKTSQRDVTGKSFYCLTKYGWNQYKQLIHNNPSLIPASDYNYNTTGLVYHDASVGTIFFRFLLLKMPFIYTRYYFTKGTRKPNDVYPDAIVRLLPSSDNEIVLYVENDTGTEGIEAIIEKIGKYYFKNLSTIKKTII